MVLHAFRRSSRQPTVQRAHVPPPASAQFPARLNALKGMYFAPPWVDDSLPSRLTPVAERGPVMAGQSVIATYESLPQAESAIDLLLRSGYDSNHISLIAPHFSVNG